jgi:hypothetical protein
MSLEDMLGYWVGQFVGQPWLFLRVPVWVVPLRDFYSGLRRSKRSEVREAIRYSLPEIQALAINRRRT